MSIYVYVTRKADPLDEGEPKIALEEWAELVRNDPDLSMEDPADMFAGDRTKYAVWRSYPGGYPAWFGLADGNIEVKGVDDAILRKLRGFAARLGANIVSEEGELFE